MSTLAHLYKYLARKPQSVYKQLFIKDRWIAARTLFGQYLREDNPMTLEEIAEDYDLPLEAVSEAISYCQANPRDIQEDWAREEAVLQASGMNDPDYLRSFKRKVLTPEEMGRLNRL